MNTSLLRTCLLLLTLLATCILPGGVTAQGGAPAADLKARLWGMDGLTSLPQASGARKAALTAALHLPTADPTALGDWTRLAFESYRDGNWEIYLAHGDGTQPVRLTNHAADDIRPRLNRGAEKIVFASNRGGNYDIYTMNADGSNVRQLTTHGPSDSYPAWSPDGARIVFAYYKDEDWEIYVMNADGSGQTRLTYGGGPDLMPAWSPDGRQIAWVQRSSNGFARLMVMNADGRDQRALTPSLKYLQFPAWSPDGSQIAFDHDADGDDWNELAVIGRDGSGLHTVYDPGGALMDAWQGSWAPDGTKLICSLLLYVVQNYQLYIAAAGPVQINLADGVASLLPGSGVDMSFDWQTADIWPPTSQMPALPAQSPSPFTVSWAGADTGPAGIAGYDVQVRDGASAAWADWQTGTLATSAVYPGLGGHTYYFRVRARDLAGNVEPWPADYDAMTTVEARPPETAVKVLPSYLRNASAIHWQGYDPGGSGIRGYDVQTRDLTVGGWIDWLVGVTDTTANFTGVSGRSYAFRSRATDNAGNVEPWPADPGDTSAILYTWAATGVVYDNTSRAVPQATITTRPAPFRNRASAADGAYAAYVTEPSATYTVTWAKPGYGNLPPTVFAASADAQVNAVLPPLNNQVRNGDFESGSLEPGWRATGIYAAQVTTEAWHTGAYAARFGERFEQLASVRDLTGVTPPADLPSLAMTLDGVLHLAWRAPTGVRYSCRGTDGVWTAPIYLTRAPTDVRATNLVADAHGIVHALWQSAVVGGDNALHYARRNDGGNWSVPERVPDVKGGSAPRYAIGNDGTVLIVWEGPGNDDSPYTDIWGAWRRPDGVWVGPTNISHNYGFSDAPDLAIGNDGAFHLVWPDSTNGGYMSVLYARCETTGGCTEPQNISVAEGSGHAHNPRIAASTDGGFHVVWAYQSEDPHITYRRRGRDGTWSLPERMPGASWGQQLRLTTDAAGVLHIVGRNDYIWGAQRDRQGTWTPATIVPGSGGTVYYEMIMTPTGAIHLVWQSQAEGNDEIYYALGYAGGAWTTARNISHDAGVSTTPRIGLDAHEIVHLVWGDATGRASRILYAGPTLMPQTGDAAVVQTFVLPEAVPAPALSWLYRFEQSWQDSRNRFEVELQGSTTASPIFTTTETTADWTHRWFDLTPWAGQTVTLTFSIHQEAGAPTAWAYLDEVTVGSAAYPDLWTAGQTQIAAPGATVTFTLPYGNRGEAIARGAALTVTLPVSMTFVAAHPPASVSGSTVTWSLGDLPAGPTAHAVALEVAADAPAGSLLTGVATLASGTNEIEAANNTVALHVYVGGARRYLPLALAVSR